MLTLSCIVPYLQLVNGAAYDTRQVARAPSAQEMAALQLQLQLNAAGARASAPQFFCQSLAC
jgi:hypothetical protein